MKATTLLCLPKYYYTQKYLTISLSQTPTNHNMKQNSNDYMSLHTLETQFWTFAKFQKKEGERF
jgi:hypothetical protein